MNERYQTITRRIKQAIISGRYPPGAPLPSRHTLARCHKVTRSTIDRCIALLARDGIVSSRQGAITRVTAIPHPYTLAFAGRPDDVRLSAGSKQPRLIFFPYEHLAHKSQRNLLLRHDGIIWHLPDETAIPWIESFEGQIPQIVINRHWPDFNYVSTAHEEAIYQITRKRLDAYRGARPFFLLDATEPRHPVNQMRQAGFIRACQEHDVFYRILEMPPGFIARQQYLEAHLKIITRKPLLLVSANLRFTGPVMFWAHDHQARWKQDVLYSDFDNFLSPDVWGAQVTTYRQNYQRLVTGAIEALKMLIERKTKRIQKLVPATAVPGDT